MFHTTSPPFIIMFEMFQTSFLIMFKTTNPSVNLDKGSPVTIKSQFDFSMEEQDLQLENYNNRSRYLTNKYLSVYQWRRKFKYSVGFISIEIFSVKNICSL